MIEIKNASAKPGVKLMPNHYRFQSEEVRMFKATEVLEATDPVTGVVDKFNSKGRTIKYNTPRTFRRLTALVERKKACRERCHAN